MLIGNPDNIQIGSGLGRNNCTAVELDGILTVDWKCEGCTQARGLLQIVVSPAVYRRAGTGEKGRVERPPDARGSEIVD